VILGLQGNLGGGKTTFLQGFARGLGIKEKITSPTYVILKHFKITKPQISNSKSQINSKSKNSKFGNFYHIDYYRLKDERDLVSLGFKEIIKNPKNIAAIEWPEKIYPVEFAEGDVLQKAKRFNRGKKSLPKPTFIIKFKFINENEREIEFKM